MIAALVQPVACIMLKRFHQGSSSLVTLCRSSSGGWTRCSRRGRSSRRGWLASQLKPALGQQAAHVPRGRHEEAAQLQSARKQLPD